MILCKRTRYYINMSYLKLVTQTDRIPASAAARHATGTTSETCLNSPESRAHQIF